MLRSAPPPSKDLAATSQHVAPMSPSPTPDCEAEFTAPMLEAMDCISSEQDVVPVDNHTIIVSAKIVKHAIIRIRRVLDYEFRGQAIFSLTKIPVKAYWGGAWDPIALAYNGQAIIIRAVGTIATIDTEGAQYGGQQLSIALELLRAVDYMAFIDLLKRAPYRKVQFPDHMHLTHDVQSQGQDVKEVYDATTRFRPAVHMKKIAFSSLCVGDVVIAECTCEQVRDDVTFNLLMAQRVICHRDIPATMYPRFRRLADYGSNAEGLFSLTRVPHEIQWDNECVPPTLAVDGEPMGLRVVGSVLETGTGGGDRNSFYADVLPLRGVDQEGMFRLFELARPVPDQLADSIRLFWIEGGNADTSPPLHDATHRLRPERFMNQIQPEEIATGDVVIADCLVIKQTHSQGWDVLFELVGMAVLARVARARDD
ncbi:hypothetical protein VTO73DRAFT_6170 [Trametes versicolor]